MSTDVHDRKCLPRPHAAEYGREEAVIAAIDRTLDTQPPDAFPILMFSFCATIAPATLPLHTSTASGLLVLTADHVLPSVISVTISSWSALTTFTDALPAPAEFSDTLPALSRVIQNYHQEIGPNSAPKHHQEVTSCQLGALSRRLFSRLVSRFPSMLF